MRVIKRKILTAGSFPPSGEPILHERRLAEILEVRRTSSRGCRLPRAVKRKMSNYPTGHRRLPGPSELSFLPEIGPK